MKYQFVPRETSKNPFEVGSNPKKTLHGFSQKLVLSKSKNMNKTDATKDTRGKKEERLTRKKDGIRNLIMQNG